MKSLYLKSFVCIFYVCLLSSCSSETEAQSSAAAPNDYMTGNKFFDAASTKFMAALPGMPRYKTNCMVETMTADGKYGIGELNQMKLKAVEMSQNSDGLVEAYYAAMKKCQSYVPE